MGLGVSGQTQSFEGNMTCQANSRTQSPGADGHVYGAFNIAYGIGSAGSWVQHSRRRLPPSNLYPQPCSSSWPSHRWSGKPHTRLVAMPAETWAHAYFQLYDHTSNGWMTIAFLDLGLIAICTVITACFFGDPTALRSMMVRLRASRRLRERRSGASDV